MAERARPFVLQWSLRTMFLLTAMVAVLVAYLCLLQQNARLERGVAGMQEWAGELVVEDTKQIAVMKLPETWYDENRWEIHLPEGEYVMRLATREIGEQGFAPAAEETPVNSGEHLIELLQSDEGDCRRITVMLDDQSLIETTEASDWDPGHGAPSGGISVRSTQLSPHEPVILFRRRFRPRPVGIMPKGITNGLLLWIERIKPPDTAGEGP